ncbi:hypothetical protein Tco_1204225 [Tanacetum coccineum]
MGPLLPVVQSWDTCFKLPDVQCFTDIEIALFPLTGAGLASRLLMSLRTYSSLYPAVSSSSERLALQHRDVWLPLTIVPETSDSSLRPLLEFYQIQLDAIKTSTAPSLYAIIGQAMPGMEESASAY